MQTIMWYAEMFVGCVLLFVLLSLPVIVLFSFAMQSIVAIESKTRSPKEDGLWTHNTIDIEPIDIVRMQQSSESTKRRNAEVKTRESCHSWYESYIRDIGSGG